MSIADQSGLRPVLPEAGYQRQLQEGALVLSLYRSRRRLQRERRARRDCQGTLFSDFVRFTIKTQNISK